MPDTITQDPGIDVGYSSPAPQIPTATSAPQNQQSSFPIASSPYQTPTTGQDMDIAGVKDLLGVLDPNNPGDKKIQDAIQHTFSYTPEKRAQDMYDQLFGITRTTDPQTGKQQTSHNWGKFLLGMVGETLRGASEKGAYVPPMERFRQQANAQFQAEATPLAHELQYQTQERRTAMQTMQRYVANLTNAQQRQQSNEIAQQRADTYAKNQSLVGPARAAQLLAEADATATLTPGKKAYIDAETKAQEEAAKLSQARQGLTWQQEVNAALNQGQSGDDAFAMRQARLKSSGDPKDKQIAELEAASRAAEYQQKNPGTFTPGENGQAYNTRYNYSAPLGGGAPTSGPQIPNTPPAPFTPGGQVFPQGTNPTAPGGPLTAVPQVNGMPIPSTPKGLAKWDSPQDLYGNAAAMGAPGVPLANTPLGRTPQNDATQFIPFSGKKLDAATQKETDSAASLWQTGQHFADALSKVNPAKLGVISGNWNKFAMGSVPTDPELRYLQSTAHALAMAHLGAQGSRSGNLAKVLVDTVNTPGTSKEEMLKAVQGLTDQAGNVIREHPEARGRVETVLKSLGADYYDREKLVHPDQYKHDIQELAKQELARRKTSGSSTDANYLNSITNK